jgi:1-hydroxycarotenoid 3,4-desaturase
MADATVIVVGAGVAALELAQRGLRVTVLERAAHAGGKLRECGQGPARGDAGPTVFTMRWVFDELLDALGERPSALPLAPLPLLARHAWPDGSMLDLHADLERSADAIGAFAGAAEARGYRAFCRRAAAAYAALEQPFLRATRPNPLSLLARGGWGRLPGLLRISPFATLWSALGGHYADPRLRQLFGRYATYCGSSPLACPATLMLVAHVERTGVWRVVGGMQALVRLLERLLHERGARLRCGAHVERLLVAQGRVRGVELAGGERLDADAVVFAGDSAALAAGLLGEAARRAAPAPRQRSLSALTWNLAARTDGLPLAHHNVFFGPAYAEEFEAVFARGTLPSDPTTYVCAPDAADAHPVQRLFCLVNAPAGRPLHDEEIERCERQTFRQLARCGLTLHPLAETTVRTTPMDFARLFPGTGGALYGEASHGWQASFRRPTQRTPIPGLVLAGGSTHPGPGVPMAALSGRLAAAEVLRQCLARRVSISMSRPAATPGGISTR